MGKRLNILISAYACHPDKGSESAVGWGWSTAIAKHHDVWVLTSEHNQNGIAAVLASDASLRKHYHPVYVRPFRHLQAVEWIEHHIWPPIDLFVYKNIWQRRAYRVAQRLHDQIGFDVAHNLTYVGFRVPGYLWRLDIPFIWGPLGGLENTPWRFLPVLGLKGFLYFAFRNIINTMQIFFLPAPKKAFRKASGGIIAATEEIKHEILHWYGKKSVVICEVGPPDVSNSQLIHREQHESLRIIWSGIHDPGKALNFLLYALKMLNESIDWQLSILGDGPCTKKWRELSEELNIEPKCTWHGWLPRDEALEKIRNSHICVITSMKELTSTVTIEAFTLGVPVICPDHYGFSNVVNNNCGIKIPVETPSQFIGSLKSAIEYLAKNEEKRRQLALGALRRANDFSWKQKRKQINKIYSTALNASN